MTTAVLVRAATDAVRRILLLLITAAGACFSETDSR